jgi:hypothetical protein
MIKIGSLTKERREGKATLTVEEAGEVRQEEIRLSFRKPIESLWRELLAIEKAEGPENKTTIVAQLVRVDLQSPDIVNDDETATALTADKLNALDILQLAELWEGVKAHFFPQMPESKSETNTNSICEQASAA